ncbi:hypothetical protein [Halobellus sp. Atlit-38R]|nr:hypothetical protein [Halobellus sp. Atlit-38R]
MSTHTNQHARGETSSGDSDQAATGRQNVGIQRAVRVQAVARSD